MAIALSGRTPRLRTSLVHTSCPPWNPARTGLNSIPMHSSASSLVMSPSSTCSSLYCLMRMRSYHRASLCHCGNQDHPHGCYRLSEAWKRVWHGRFNHLPKPPSTVAGPAHESCRQVVREQLTSSLSSFLLMFHSCSRPFKGPRSTTATLPTAPLWASSSVSLMHRVVSHLL